MNTLAEENYIKAIFHLSDAGQQEVPTNAIAEKLDTTPASVTDMLKKLSHKGLVNYKKYQGVNISATGKTLALKIIRKHRLWETFLVEKLNFTWDEVHDVAEQLEHVQSSLLVERLDRFLGYPETDPHGEPIPTAEGKIMARLKIVLADFEPNQTGKVVAVEDSNPSFLQYLDKIGIAIGASIRIVDIIDFDKSMQISVDNNPKVSVSEQVTNNIYCVLES